MKSNKNISVGWGHFVKRFVPAILTCTMLFTTVTSAGVVDNTGNSALELRVGEYSDSQETETVFGLLWKIYWKLDQVFQSASNGKAAVAGVLTSNGVSTANDASFETIKTNIQTMADKKYNAGKAAGRNTFIASIGTKAFSFFLEGGREYPCSFYSYSWYFDSYAHVKVDAIPSKDLRDYNSYYNICKLYKNDTMFRSATKDGYYNSFGVYGCPVDWPVSGKLLCKDTGEVISGIRGYNCNPGSSYASIDIFGYYFGSYRNTSEEAYIKAKRTWVFIPDYDQEFWILGLS